MKIQPQTYATNDEIRSFLSFSLFLSLFTFFFFLFLPSSLLTLSPSFSAKDPGAGQGLTRANDIFIIYLYDIDD